MKYPNVLETTQLMIEKNVVTQEILNRDTPNITIILDRIIAQVEQLNSVFNNELNSLLNLLEDFPHSKPAFLKKLNFIRDKVDQYLNLIESDDQTIKKEQKYLKEILDRFAAGMDITELKQNVYRAMYSGEWEYYKKYFFCPFDIYRYVVQAVVVENAYKFCDYLLTANITIKNNLVIISDLLESIVEGHQVIIRLRIKQIQQNWSAIVENVELVKKQPNIFKGCF